MINSHICLSFLAVILDNPLRRIIHNPVKILGGLISKGQTVMDIGCGPGLFTIAMARMVGNEGRVIAVDIQKHMLERVRRRVVREGLQSCIQLHQCQPDRIGIQEQADFVLAFWMVHEVPNAEAFLSEVSVLLKPEAHFLLVEPKLHVSAKKFQREVEIACAAGMKPYLELKVRLSRAVLFAQH